MIGRWQCSMLYARPASAIFRHWIILPITRDLTGTCCRQPSIWPKWCRATQKEVRKNLLPIFSSVTVKRASSPAFTLPRVSCTQPDVLDALARHYYPGAVRLDLVVSSVERGPDMTLMDKITRRKLLWNLRDYFEQVEVVDARVHQD